MGKYRVIQEERSVFLGGNSMDHFEKEKFIQTWYMIRYIY